MIARRPPSQRQSFTVDRQVLLKLNEALRERPFDPNELCKRASWRDWRQGLR